MDSVSSSGPAGRELPSPLRFDPGGDPLPAPLAEEAGGPGSIVLLVDVSGASTWAADAVIALAAAWGKAGRRIVLADLHLEEPMLHERLGESNHDGVVDLFLYGASLARSARPVRDRGFYLIPAGTYPADPAAVFQHPRWAKLAAGFRDAGASLLLFVPGDAPELKVLAEWSTGAILLGAPESEPEITSLLPPGLPLHAVLTPPPGAVETGISPEHAGEIPVIDAPEGTVPEEEPATVREVAEPEVPEPVVSTAADAAAAAPATGERIATAKDRGATKHVPAVLELPDEEPEPVESPVIAAEPVPSPRPRRGMPRLVWVAVGLILALAAATYLAAHLRPDLFGLGALTDPEREIGQDPQARRGADARGASAPASTPTGVLLPYAVHVRAFRTLSAAREQVAVEERRLDDHAAYISPELIQGVRWYRVLIGFPGDSAAAVDLRERLVEVGAIDRDDIAGSLTLIQYTPLAFHLGDFSTGQEASARADSLVERGIPSYAVLLPYADGSVSWRLYAGAYADSAQAEEMQELLDAAGVDASLVERIGQPSRDGQ